MINPKVIENMGYRMSQVYGSCVDQLLVNIARYFPYIKDGQAPQGSFDYSVRMLAQMGQVTQESIDIIMQTLGGADPVLRQSLLTAIEEVLSDVEPTLRKAAQSGLLGTRKMPPKMSPNMTQAFQMYYKQSADKLNLVNTVMLESTKQAYRSTVLDISSRMRQTQLALNASTGQVVAGVSTWNQAMRQAVQQMVQTGITGFIDHGGHRWSPEAYVAMDIRTTVSNTARATVWEANEQYGNDLYSVSSHNGARPLCYPWQGKVISRTDFSREVEDLHGDIVHVYAQSETSYGQAAGLFGINCGHFPYPFVPGMSVVRGEPQDPEDNERTYEESQQQRKLERDLRNARRDLAVGKAQGLPPEELRPLKDKVGRANDALDDFCDRTGRNRRRGREYTPVRASFPPPDSYDPSTFTSNTRDFMQQYYANGGAQQGMSPITMYRQQGQTAPQTPQAPQANPGVESTRDFSELKQYMKTTYGIDLTAGVGKLDFASVRESLTGFEHVVRDYPEIGKIVQQGRLSKSGIMSCNGTTLTFNSDYYTTRSVLDGAIQQAVKDHWWPNNATPASIGVHETAHALESLLIDISGKYPTRLDRIMAWNNCTEAASILGEACDNLRLLPEHAGKTNVELIKEVSGYAYKGGASEAMAESFADVFANGENASPLAREIVKVSRQRYLQYIGGATP